MDSDWYERLAPPGIPDPWLAVIDPGGEDYVIQVAENQLALDISRLKTQWSTWVAEGAQIVVVRDNASLRVHYRSGIPGRDRPGGGPAYLGARRNWFLRYKNILDAHLSQPLVALAQFYEKGPANDLLGSMRSSRSGPFSFPKHADWPPCGKCGKPMAFIGTLDFPRYRQIGGLIHVPEGSLVLHSCDLCSLPCTDEESTSLTWITGEMPLGLRADSGAREDMIEVGLAFETVEFPTPAICPENLTDNPDFLKEWGIYENFACPLNKVGGAHLLDPRRSNTPGRERESNVLHRSICRCA